MGKYLAFHNGLILKQFKNGDSEHLKVSLYNNGNRKMFLVHRLVALAFIENPNRYPIINHKDENPKNNNKNNLEWCTISYNNNYGTAIERSSKGHYRKIVQLDKKGKLIKVWSSIKAAKLQFSGDAHGISDCCKYPDKHKSVKGYMWQYYEDYINNESKQYKDNKEIPIVQLSKTGEFIKKWDSAIIAVRCLGYKSNKISECCKKNRKSFHGCMWMYLSDYQNNNIIKPFVSEKIKSVVQLSLNNNYIKTWESAAQISKYLNKTNGTMITSCCKGKIKNAYGYKWMYESDYKDNIN